MKSSRRPGSTIRQKTTSSRQQATAGAAHPQDTTRPLQGANPGRDMQMPIVSPETLYQTGHALFVAAGTSPEEAQIVMEHLVGANLAGHDSHGIILLPTYIARIKRGDIVPGAPMSIEQETPTS